MAKIKDKVFFAYNEANILRLGAQLLLGVQLQETLDAGFQDLPALAQRLHAGATVMLLIGFGLLVAPLMFNRIVEEGLPTEELHAFTARTISLGVIPFVLSLGVDFDIVTTKAGSERAGAIAGLVTVATVLPKTYKEDGQFRARLQEQPESVRRRHLYDVTNGKQELLDRYSVCGEEQLSGDEIRIWPCRTGT